MESDFCTRSSARLGCTGEKGVMVFNITCLFIISQRGAN